MKKTLIPLLHLGNLVRKEGFPDLEKGVCSWEGEKLSKTVM